MLDPVILRSLDIRLLDNLVAIFVHNVKHVVQQFLCILLVGASVLRLGLGKLPSELGRGSDTVLAAPHDTEEVGKFFEDLTTGAEGIVFVQIAPDPVLTTDEIGAEEGYVANTFQGCVGVASVAEIGHAAGAVARKGANLAGCSQLYRRWVF